MALRVDLTPIYHGFEVDLHSRSITCHWYTLCLENKGNIVKHFMPALKAVRIFARLKMRRDFSVPALRSSAPPGRLITKLP